MKYFKIFVKFLNISKWNISSCISSTGMIFLFISLSMLLMQTQICTMQLCCKFHYLLNAVILLCNVFFDARHPCRPWLLLPSIWQCYAGSMIWVTLNMGRSATNCQGVPHCLDCCHVTSVLSDMHNFVTVYNEWDLSNPTIHVSLSADHQTE